MTKAIRSSNNGGVTLHGNCATVPCMDSARTGGPIFENEKPNKKGKQD